MEYNSAEKQLMLATFELGQAQRALEDAERKFREALHATEIANPLGGRRRHKRTGDMPIGSKRGSPPTRRPPKGICSESET